MSEKKELQALAKSIFDRSSGEVLESWCADARQSADRLPSGIFLKNTGDGDREKDIELTFPKKAISIICGKTGGGKTTLMLNVAVNLVLKGYSGVFLTLEEPEFSLASKTMALFDVHKSGTAHAKTTYEIKRMMKNGTLEQWEHLAEYRRTIARELVFVDANKQDQPEHCADPSNLYNPEWLDLFAQFFKNLDFIIVDYVQLMSCGDYHESAYVNIKKVMQALRTMTGKHSGAIILGAQLNRQVSNMPFEEWQPEHLREAADIEQNANMIIATGRIKTENSGIAVGIRALKNRDGNPFIGSLHEVSYEHSYIGNKPVGSIEVV